MAELTREQIEVWIAQNAANDWGADMSTDDQAEVLRLSLLGLSASPTQWERACLGTCILVASRHGVDPRTIADASAFVARARDAEGGADSAPNDQTEDRPCDGPCDGTGSWCLPFECGPDRTCRRCNGTGRIRVRKELPRG